MRSRFLRKFPFDAALAAVFFALVIQIFVLSYSNSKGGLTADSKNYLFLAENLLNGHGLWVRDLYAESGRSYFAVWPAGYSAMIALIGGIFPVDLVLASKLVNIFLIAFTLWVFSRIFGKDAAVFGSVFFLDSVVRFTYRTWVQTPLVVGFIMLALALHYAHYHRKEWFWIATVIACALFAFLSSYIGLTALFAIGLLGVWLLFREDDTRSFLKLALAGTVAAFFVIGYFYLNYRYTGSPTGMERINPHDDPLFLLQRLFLRILEELKLPFIIALFFIIARKFLPKEHLPHAYAPPKNAGTYWPFFLLVALTHIVPLVTLRFFMRFDDFGGRMLGPASLLFALAALDYLRVHARRAYPLLIRCIALGCAVTFLYHGPITGLKHWNAGEMTYTQARVELEKKYADLKTNSIVLFGSYDLIYLGKTTQPANPFPFYGDYIYGREYEGDFKEDIGKNESIEAYVRRRCKLGVSAIYVDIGRWQPKTEGGYISVQQLVDKHPGEEIVKVSDCPPSDLS